MKIKEFIGRVYEEYLEIPEEGKLREKVFVTRIMMGIIFMCIWLGMMGFSAYAYFSSSVTSGTNTIVSATYSLDVAVAPSEKVVENSGVYVLENQSTTENQTYKFTLTKAGDASAKVGYGKVIVKKLAEGEVESLIEIYTTPIGKYKDAAGKEIDVQSMPVEITVAPGETVTVEFVANWGSYSGDDAMASVALDYGLSEEELQQIQTTNDVVDETTQTTTPTNQSIDKVTQESTTEENTTPEETENDTAVSTDEETVDNVITDTTTDSTTDTTTEDSLGENVIEVPESEEVVEETENR